MKEIYVVEDDHDIRGLIELLLISNHYKVQSFPTAKDFQKGITSGRPDLVLLDIMLPDGNGIEICRNLSTNSQTESIPVVLMSAHADANITAEVGARDFISKPFDVEDFLNRIKKQVS